MGNDGGSIPTRRELVRTAQSQQASSADLTTSRLERQKQAWTTDPASRAPLEEPIVSDALGRLFSKATMLEYLVEGRRKEEVEAALAGVRVAGLRDLVEVSFTPADGEEGERRRRWVCPITGEELGPAIKAVYLVPCGHAFAARAVREVIGDERRCTVCEAGFEEADVIPILPQKGAKELESLERRRMDLAERGLGHSLKKATSAGGRKRKKGEAKEAKNEDQDVTAAGINNASTASLTAKVLRESEMAKKRRRENETVRTLFSGKERPLAHNGDFMTRGYSVSSTTKRGG